MTHNQQIALLMGFIITVFVSFTAFLFFYNCAYWPETDDWAICYTRIMREAI